MLPMTGFEPRTSDAKAITLPTEPQPLPKKLSRNGYFELKFGSSLSKSQSALNHTTKSCVIYGYASEDKMT